MTSQQTIDRAATDADKTIVLPDHNNTTLQEGDILTCLRTEETLLVTGIKEDRDSIAFYSNHEGLGHHQLRFIPDCFDFVIRNNGKEIQTIGLEPSKKKH